MRIAVDVGGTFTDVVVATGDGELHTGKVLTTPLRAWEGIRGGLSVVAEDLGIALRDLVGASTYFLYSTTRATNAIIEETTARTAFLVTEGFPDILLYREGGKSEPFNLTMPVPAPYVPRHLTFEIPERIESRGQVIRDLDETAVLSIFEELRALEVEAVGVSLLWSVANPVHELRIAEMITEELPGLPFTVSHQLNPIIREYRRSSGTCIDASLKPLMQQYLKELEQDLAQEGFGGVFVVGNSLGGVSRVEEVMEKPILSVGSGPALAPVAALEYDKIELPGDAAEPRRDLVVVDTGGTSFDVSLVTDGTIRRSRDTWLGEPFLGHLTGLASVDVRSIGAGGGSIAWIDAGGLLQVGPRSAGAMPGPACYGLGGTEPTVTDAALVLGYIDPNEFAGGRLTLSPDGALTAITDHVCGNLDISPQEAAAAILDVASVSMVSAIRELTVKQGFDPRESMIAAGGGAAGLNIIPIAIELGCRELMIPRNAGVLSAVGGHFADVVTEIARSHFTTAAAFDFAKVNGILAELDAELDVIAAESSVMEPESVEKDYSVEARYPFQSWELNVPLADVEFSSAQDVLALVETFHQHHEDVFQVREPGDDLECLRWSARVQIRLPLDRAISEVPDAGGIEMAPTSTAPAYFREIGLVADVPHYRGRQLMAGHTIEGPAIVNERSTTLVVYPGMRLRVSRFGNYLIDTLAGGPSDAIGDPV